MSKLNKQNSPLDWFNLSDYERLNELSRSDWDSMLRLKRAMFNSLAKQEHKIEGYALEFMLDFFVLSSKTIIEACVNKNLEINTKSVELDEVISDFDFVSLAFYCEEVFLSKNKKAIDFLETLKSECESPTIDLSNAPEEYKNSITPMDWLADEAFDLKDAVKVEGNVWCIDTSFSDEAIIEAVKEKLKRIRHNKDAKRFSDSEINRFIKFRVIPYIDLFLWSNLTGTKLTDQNMADLLFSDDSTGKGLDTIRQTTKKKALLLLSNTLAFI